MKLKNIIKTQTDREAFIVSLIKVDLEKSPLEIYVEKHNSKGTSKQLRSFWFLIKVCKDWMNSEGNNFSDEEVATFFKLEAGHFNLVKGYKIPRSIATNSGTTSKEMRKIITTILEFGYLNHIQECYLEDYELKSLLACYENNNYNISNDNVADEVEIDIYNFI